MDKMQLSAFGLRQDLRARTAEAHRLTDDALRRDADVTTVKGYGLFLKIMSEAHATFCNSLDRSGRAAGLPIRATGLLRALACDLGALEHTSGAPADAALRLDPTDPALRATAFDVGVGYALEGSALGAEVLRRQVRSAQPAAPTRYLDALAGQRRQRWLQYCAWLNSPATAEYASDDVAIGAIRVFSSVNDSISKLRCE